MKHDLLVRGKKARQFRHLIWHFTCWCLWLCRNKVIFQGSEPDAFGVFSHIQVVSWSWVVYKGSLNNGFSYGSWCN